MEEKIVEAIEDAFSKIKSKNLPNLKTFENNLASILEMGFDAIKKSRPTSLKDYALTIAFYCLNIAPHSKEILEICIDEDNQEIIEEVSTKSLKSNPKAAYFLYIYGETAFTLESLKDEAVIPILDDKNIADPKRGPGKGKIFTPNKDQMKYETITPK